jgi:hypothetical protein
MSKTGLAVLFSVIFLGGIYFALMPAAAGGYGYMGYHGYHRGPSFWYFGGPTTYYDRNVRGGSLSGSDFRGGGPGVGK